MSRRFVNHSVKLCEALLSHHPPLCALCSKQVTEVAYPYPAFVSLWHRVKHWDFWSLIEKGSGAVCATFYLGDFRQWDLTMRGFKFLICKME